MRASGLLLSSLLGAFALASSSLAADPAVPRDFKLPAGVDAVLYLPAGVRNYHSVFSGIGTVESGNLMGDSLLGVAKQYFASVQLINAAAGSPYGLLIAVHPDIHFEHGILSEEMRYSVFGADDKEALQGTQTATVTLNGFNAGGDVIDKLSKRAMDMVMIDVIAKLRPDRTKYPSTAKVGEQPPGFVASRDKPASSGTGFYFNASGQILTAAHVIHECIAIEVGHGDKSTPGTVVVSSNLLDLAVIDAGTPAEKYLPFRRGGNFELGESVSDVGYPLQTILATSPTLTRGNISSRGGLEGSAGQIQFSAPVQPGSSGGPLVSDGGELLGIAVGTLNSKALVASGTIPQNLNFALDARYAAMFLRKNGLPFTEVDANTNGSMRTANDAALGAVVSIRCYQ